MTEKSYLEKCIDDLKKFHGIAPYNTPGNLVFGDGYFYKHIKETYTDDAIKWAEGILNASISKEETPMDVKVAALKMQEIILDAPTWQLNPPELGRHHLLGLLTMIMTGKVEGEKAHRWLGWVQAATLANGGFTLEEMKRINKES